jgi:hypothetical protein
MKDVLAYKLDTFPTSVFESTEEMKESSSSIFRYRPRSVSIHQWNAGRFAHNDWNGDQNAEQFARNDWNGERDAERFAGNDSNDWNTYNGWNALTLISKFAFGNSRYFFYYYYLFILFTNINRFHP